MQITIAVVDYKTLNNRHIKGVCSNWLANLEIGSEVAIWHKPGALPSVPADKPLIMVGPGTGIAPFRAFIQEREGKESYLVFGCRNEKKDFYYQREWEESKDLKLFTAFSRDGDSKKYVQHVIRENKELFADLILNKEARIYICGRAKNMPKFVQKAFSECLQTKLSEAEAEKFIEEMQKRKKTYCLDVW